ncbi:MAG: hypothetical protein IKR59_08470 [Lachnospiraceae bacterium]|nr:hypothetical protein [Lachnospiraceae bacterium]
MSKLMKADIYRMVKSRLTLVALIMVLAFPVLMVLMYLGIQAIAGVGDEMEEAVTLFTANSLIGSIYSMTNNVGLVIPAFAGILVCSDYTNGTLRNKVIAGNRRTQIYLSHLIVSILFCVVMITIYAAMTTGLALIFFDFAKDESENFGREVLYFVLNGTMSFVFVSTVTTFFAMVLRNIAPTIIFTIVFTIALMAITSVVSLLDYESYKYAVYFIPTFISNFFNLSSFSLLDLLGTTSEGSRELMFAEGMLSYVFFGAVNTVAGVIIFNKRDIK